MSIANSTLCVFYDGKCPLCKKEIKRYQALISDESGHQTIDWIDINENQEALKNECINYDDAMRLIHIKDGTGMHQVGLEGMLTLWDKISYYRVVSHLIRKFPALYPFLSKSYELLAKCRMYFAGRRK